MKTMHRHRVRSALVTMASVVALLALGACADKGDGKGKRATRPDWGYSGGIMDPVPPDMTQGLADPLDTLAACYGIDKVDVARFPATQSALNQRVAAAIICKDLKQVGFLEGVSNTKAPVEIE